MLSPRRGHLLKAASLLARSTGMPAVRYEVRLLVEERRANLVVFSDEQPVAVVGFQKEQALELADWLRVAAEKL